METAILKVSSQGQITIPKEWRKKMGKQGDTVLAVLHKDKDIESIYLLPAETDWNKNGFGLLKDALKTTNTRQYLNNLRDEWHKTNE
ncbi:MAG: AbrB/MazE/SpoVT family DNA-binding domain-containing protein [bacterium]|nr:AbrB/MazE/SpoVT family DNA-binding domain-containing protein [bacterium]